MRIFVTGGTGFFGKNLIAHPLSAEHELTILSRDPERFQAAHPELRKPNVKFIQGDIRTFSMPEGFEYVIHGAADTVDRDSAENCDTILLGTQRLLERAKGVKRLLFISSGAAGNRTPYGQAKLAAEQACLDSGIPTVIARCYSFVGPYMDLNAPLAVNRFFAAALQGKEIVVEDGAPVRSYLHADELVETIYSLLGAADSLRIHYEVGSNWPIPIAELAAKIAWFARVPLRVKQMNNAHDRYFPGAFRACPLRSAPPVEALQKTWSWYGPDTRTSA